MEAEDTFLSRWLGLCEPPGPDPDGTYSGAVCPPDQATVCWYFAWLSLFSSLVGIYYGHYDLAFFTFLIFLTSLFYWRNPTYSWRRNLDIIVVQIGIIWHTYRALHAENKIPYFAFLFSGMGAFLLGWFFFKQGQTWLGTISHTFVHILMNVAVLFLYVGHIEPAGVLARLSALFLI